MEQTIIFEGENHLTSANRPNIVGCSSYLKGNPPHNVFNSDPDVISPTLKLVIAALDE